MKKVAYFFLFGGAAIFIGAIAIAGYLVYGFYRAESQLDSVPLSPANYQPAMLELIKLCQSDPGFYDRAAIKNLDMLDPVWAPPAVAKLHPEMMNIDSDHASVTWGGGFYHCGWELKRGAAAAGSSYVWTLSFVSERPSQNKMLQTLTVGTDQLFTKDQFIAQVLAEYDHRLATHADDNSFTDIAEWYPAAARCLFLARYRRIDLLPAEIRKSAANYPHDWRDVLLAYLIDHAANDPMAGDRLRQWADRTACPAAWIYAAYAFYQASDNAAGDDAVTRALASKQSEPSWLDKEIPSYELGMALRLYRSANFDGCLSLCKGTLSTPHRYIKTRISIEHVRDWAANPASRPAELPDFSEYTALDPFGGFDLNLLNASPSSLPNLKPSN